MTGRPKIGVVALARPTFDVPFAGTVAEATFAALDRLEADIIGSRDLLFDAEGTRQAIARIGEEPLDLMLVLQVTFTDATMTVALAEELVAPLALWAFPEDRAGGRLRINSLCGINLAAHALGRAGRRFDYLYRRPDDPGALDELREILRGRDRQVPTTTADDGIDGAALARAEEALGRLNGARIGLFGHHPDGFDTCSFYDRTFLELTGVEVEQVELPCLFAAASAVSKPDVSTVRRRVEGELGDLDGLEQEPLEKSLRIYAALRDMAADRQYAGLAIRCWPELFTEYGCAACGPMAMLNDERIPAACEADVYGNLTTLVLQGLADGPVLMADLVDLDPVSNTGVFWHCGLAPLSMADPAIRPRATIHANRRKPLLNEFTLKPGRITIARLSQAKGTPKLVIGDGEMVRAPMSFSGTSGVVRFGPPVRDILDTVMDEGLEHHYAFAYGDWRDELRALARLWGLPVVTLT